MITVLSTTMNIELVKRIDLEVAAGRFRSRSAAIEHYTHAGYEVCHNPLNLEVGDVLKVLFAAGK